jgi:hypothetical protein
MSNIETVPEISEKVEPQVEVKIDPDVESQVIVHCVYFAGPFPSRIRIWPSTYLVDKVSGHRSKLLFSENIAKFPQWETVIGGTDFSLVFEGLPRSCETFDLYEDIPESGGFRVKDIKRNHTDVYRVPIDL